MARMILCHPAICLFDPGFLKVGDHPERSRLSHQPTAEQLDTFIATWRDSALTERAAAQSHFNQLCDLLGVKPPTMADPQGEWFCFEKG